ncbi:MAG: hypothetical protein ACYTGC_04085 [Planctomycetota bacterium]|jgi:hypothetical protein
MAESGEAVAVKSRLRTVILILALIGGEAAVIIAAMQMLSGPDAVKGESVLEGVEISQDDRIVEQLVVEGRFPNAKRGFTYIYDTEVYVQIRNRHREQVIAELEQFRNEIKAELTAIWRTAEPYDFDQPKLENLTRKVHALLNGRFGVDVETGETVVTKVVIVMGSGLRIDG